MFRLVLGTGRQEQPTSRLASVTGAWRSLAQALPCGMLLCKYSSLYFPCSLVSGKLQARLVLKR